MKEVKTEVKTYIVKAYCDCGGEYKPTGFAYATYPEMYPHDCETCKDRATFYHMYPRTVME